jgi:GH43 family beta-xylosidase
VQTERLVKVDTFQNPVYSHSFPDPYVLKFRGAYYAYSTGFWKDGNVFGVLISHDLVNWEEIGGAMKPLENSPPFYWAPEVTYSNGKFYLYYSVGNEAQMELRVATSRFPDKDFIDSGRRLTSEEFAIDAHVFLNDDGKKYLFYATDFLNHTHIGTGIVVDQMTDWFTLAGLPQPVTRAKYDWQIYDPARREKGGVRWHTVEGPFVLKRKDLYYEMFSGGNWQNISYGVSFAVSDNLTPGKEWKQFSDGEKTLPILRTIPDRITGPGHNSVVRGLNNRELYCIYHRWVNDTRVLAIDRMDFAGERIFIQGATDKPQPAPFLPKFADFFYEEKISENWRIVGNWSVNDNAVFCEGDEHGELIYSGALESNFLCEFDLCSLETRKEQGSFGFRLLRDEETVFEFMLCPNERKARISDSQGATSAIDLPSDFVFEAYHLLRIEIDGLWLKLALDENAVRFETILKNVCDGIALVSNEMRAAFSSFTLTDGFEDLFDRIEHKQLPGEWQKVGINGFLKAKDQQFFLSQNNEEEAIIYKGKTHAEYEFVANIRLDQSFDTEWAFGLMVMKKGEEEVSRFTVEGKQNNSTILIDTKKIENFNHREYNQFRFLITEGKMRFELEGFFIDEFTAPAEETQISIFCRNASILLDMVRLTVL